MKTGNYDCIRPELGENQNKKKVFAGIWVVFGLKLSEDQKKRSFSEF